jgi:phytoene dehydrogenase-like protein
MTEFDVVVAGAGHNGLVTAAYLGKAGYRVLVLEANEHVGGDTATQELVRPGYLHDSCSTAHAIFMESPIWRDQELPLAEYGLEYINDDLAVHMPFPDGTWLTQWRDLDRTCEEFAKFSPRDAATFRRMMQDWRKVAPIVSRYRYTPVGWGPPLQELLMEGLEDGGAWARREALSAWEVIRDNFEDWHTRTFMLWMAIGTVQPFDRPGTGFLAYSFAAGRQRSGWAIPKGGSGMLPRALVRFIEDRGGAVLTGKPVNRLVLAGTRCVGVGTEDGSEYGAREAVVSSIHVKHLVEMAPKEVWGVSFTYGVETWNPGISLFAAYYATSEPPMYPVEGGTVAPIAAGIATSPERLFRLHPEFTRGEVSLDDNQLLVLAPTVADRGRAPAGAHTLKLVGTQPYDCIGGPQRWDELKHGVAEANLRLLQRYAPNLTDDKILGSEVRSPLDLERYNRHNWHGSCHGGDMGPAQSYQLRPAAGWASHRTPIEGLYQTGSTTHPGGSVTGAPGRNAAMVLLSDLGRDIAEVISPEAAARAPKTTAATH